MRDTLGKSLKNLKWIRLQKKRLSGILLVLSLIVTLNVFWALRQPGLTLAGDAACGIPEHAHKDECFSQVNICGVSEEVHVHEETCYTTQLIEAQETLQLIRDQSDQSHEHAKDCYALEIMEAHEEQILTCGLSETVHIHDDTCYSRKCSCTQKEHTHSIECYSDETADVETLLDWQNIFADYPYTEDLRQDLVGIAKTQVGYSESALNFEVDSEGVRRGYTRYGAWYGAPYGDWSSMFVSFCLHYAGADPEEFPGNTGADSMAITWEKLGNYAPSETYLPVAGDLVFFTDNRVGIVTEVQNATLYVICGDVDGAVCGTSISLTNESIAGWGITIEAEPVSENVSEEMEPDIPVVPPETTEVAAVVQEDDELNYPDISNGPVFCIFADGRNKPDPQRFSIKSPRTAANIYDYLTNNGGSYFITLLDTNNNELPKDANGNYIVKSGTNYKMSMTFNGPNGIHPGTYQYQLPQGLQVNGGTGDFILKENGIEVMVGTWEVGDDGLITMVFNEEMNNRTDVHITATMGVVFPEQDEPMDFDGNIIVKVEKPPEDEKPTKLNKWGSQGSEEKGQDPTKIYWTIEVQGKADSSIPGSIITDQIKLGDHKFTQSDIDGGLHFGVGEYDLQTGEQTAWHAWDVTLPDPNLTWTENGWTYTIPESVMCKWCPAPVELGNDGWIYYIEYTSTPDLADVSGTIWYTNEVIVDGQYMEGWGNFEHGEGDSGIIKNGVFHGNANGGKFLWEFQAKIPGMEEGKKAVYLWQIMDNLRINEADKDTIGYIQNDANKAKVTATQGGKTFNVPNVYDATENNDYAWYNLWSSDHNDGIEYSRALVLLCRCHCNAENCQFWVNNACDSRFWYQAEDGRWYTNGLCYCWTETEDTIFTFSYETVASEVIEAYGGQGNLLENEVLLQNTVYLPGGTANTITTSDAKVDVPIPGVFKKELNKHFDGYTAKYHITVNESKLSLTNGSPLTIHDEMTQTLAYISGSLVITTEDASGNTGTLQQGVDYTVTYDGTGNQTDEHGNPVHVLDIVILQPQPVMYLLDYDTTLIIPDNVTSAIKYTNSATVTLWGKEMTDNTEEKTHADINIAAKKFMVELHKTDSLTGKPLAGATFGLFNEQGRLISSDVTDANGKLLFETNMVEGIILREHVLYYMQELKAPPGYQLDDTNHWFCFCENKDAVCETCNNILAGLEGFRIPYDTMGILDAENELMDYDLPATGGPGIYPLILVSVMFIVIPLVYGPVQRRKRERRRIR